MKDIATLAIEKLQLQATYKRCFGTEDGRKVLEHLCKVGFIVRPIGGAGVTEQELVRRSGMQGLVLQILNFINKDTAELVEEIEKNLAGE